MRCQPLRRALGVYMILVTSVLIFLVTLVKSIFDIFVSPQLFKRELMTFSPLHAAERKRSRDARTTTITFFLISVISAINILGDLNMEAEHELGLLKSRVQKLEDVIFPKGGPAIHAQIAELNDDIEKLEASILELHESKADQAKLDEAIRILAKFKQLIQKLNFKEENSAYMSK